ncbi:hypothetical protein AJ78_08967 [Emergomyces pasteurianus Ep9510]|uniref:Uncharacterized protein n=1 Tax=Emergomyces pasteurianus Ep9510 TaxID=1447872 RepID=A0A1J9Q3H2_9EURO|nr:hypothetical protein AJ78_08967 [Emergomyces pasteurianus Ep9510]
MASAPEHSQSLLPEPAEMSQLPEGWREAIRMAAEHAAEPAKLHVRNTLLDQSLRTLNQWREQVEERNRELFTKHENVTNRNTAAFATALQSTTLKYHIKIQEMKRELQLLHAAVTRPANLEISVPASATLTDIHTPDVSRTTAYSGEYEADKKGRPAAEYIKPGDLSDSLKFNDDRKNDAALN